jgi:hypothetical protein
VIKTLKGVNMIRSNIEAELEAKKKALEEVKRDIAIARVINEMAEDWLTNLNSDYSELIYAIEDLEEQINESANNYD